VLVPGGFGHRGIEGKVLAAHFARDRRIPYLGLCLGLQCAVIDFAREVIGTGDANSTEFDPRTPHNVIDLLPEQRDVTAKGGTMRLGLYPIVLGEGSVASRIYGQGAIQERHRHRYEVNNAYVPQLEAQGYKVSSRTPSENLPEMMELPGHPFFVGVQFHPEFTSTPRAGHPLFKAYVAAALRHRAGGKLRVVAA